MNRILFLLVAIFCLLYSNVLNTYAGNIRGQVVASNPYTNVQYPLPGAKVAIYALGPNGWQIIYTYVTGGDGMYYVPNLLPGNYFIQVNGRLNYPLQVLNIPYQDVPPILVMY